MKALNLRYWHARRLLPVLFAVAAVAACSGPPETEETAMKSGLDLLYAKRDPSGAVAKFRKVLELKPDHYGANFQLAKALDQSGRREEAKPQWEKVLRAAERINDQGTASAARARLGLATPAPAAAPAAAAAAPTPPPPPGSEQALMLAGLDLLYEKKNPAAAVVEFRKVLEKNPTHYGAHFQLARALDGAGKREEARGWWEKVLKMAETIKDQPTAATASARLAQRP